MGTTFMLHILFLLGLCTVLAGFASYSTCLQHQMPQSLLGTAGTGTPCAMTATQEPEMRPMHLQVYIVHLGGLRAKWISQSKAIYIGRKILSDRKSLNRKNKSLWYILYDVPEKSFWWGIYMYFFLNKHTKQRVSLWHFIYTSLCLSPLSLFPLTGHAYSFTLSFLKSLSSAWL